MKTKEQRRDNRIAIVIAVIGVLLIIASFSPISNCMLLGLLGVVFFAAAWIIAAIAGNSENYHIN